MIGYDESTGENVEFETFDEEMFETVIEGRMEAMEASTPPHHFSGEALVAEAAGTDVVHHFKNEMEEETKGEATYVDDGPVKTLSSLNSHI